MGSGFFGAGGVDFGGFFDAGACDFLGQVGSLCSLEGDEFDGLAGVCGLVDGLDDDDVGHAFVAVGFGVSVVEDTIGEVDEFGAELVCFGEGLDA